MINYPYQNGSINKSQLKKLLAWTFTTHNSKKACLLADELKKLGFKYATQAGMSISIEDLKVPFLKTKLLDKANLEVKSTENSYSKGKITSAECIKKIVDIWNTTSELLKNEVVLFFKRYDPFNPVYFMAFSGARGNLSQVRQLVGMRGLMSDPHGEILKFPIKQNFREGLTITDYLMSGYGARKGIVDTALKTANSGYLTRRLIDVAQDIIVREKDCKTKDSGLLYNFIECNSNIKYSDILGRFLSKSIYDPKKKKIVASFNTLITPELIYICKKLLIKKIHVRSPLTCGLYRAVCQKCYGWDLSKEKLVNLGEAVGIIAGQSIGEPGTQLTMRTFHTGGIFTAETKKSIRSPIIGILKFSNQLKFKIFRTNCGQNVLLTKNSGYIKILPKIKINKLIKLELLPDTILFYKHNDYVKKKAIIGQLKNFTRQVLTEFKPILSDISGEIFISPVKNNLNLINSDKSLWVLSGSTYYSPVNSYLNFYNERKINKNSFIYRTKLINQYKGFINDNYNLNKIDTIINYNKFCLQNAIVKKLDWSKNNKKYLLLYNKHKYWIDIIKTNSNLYIKSDTTKHFCTLISNKFLTETGGTPYYDRRVLKCSILNKNSIYYFKRLNFNYNTSKENKIMFNKNSLVKSHINLIYRSIIWLAEETYTVNCAISFLNISNNDIISPNFEILPGLFSKKEGVVFINIKNNIVKEIVIKSGVIYRSNQIKSYYNKVFYPGEILFGKIHIKEPVLCQKISENSIDHLLIRPLVIYEIPYPKTKKEIFGTDRTNNFALSTISNIHYLFKSHNIIKTVNNINLAANSLDFDHKLSNNIFNLKLNKIKKKLEFLTSANLNLHNYIPHHLKNIGITLCKLVNNDQFVDIYTILGYLENITPKSLEIVKIKSKLTNKKEIFIVSNEDCFKVPKLELKDKSLNDLIIYNIGINNIGKIILETKTCFIVQRGRPYFFPNCKMDNLEKKKHSIEYKRLSFPRKFKTNRKILLNYYDLTRKIFSHKINKLSNNKNDQSLKVELSKIFIKKNNNIYSSAIPIFKKNFRIIKSDFAENDFFSGLITKNDKIIYESYPILIKNYCSKIKKLESKKNTEPNLIRAQFLGVPFEKSVGIHSLTDDFFGKDSNKLFYKNGDFIKKGEILGLLNFEKEVTEDITQGLPRIDELLEARKTKNFNKNLPTNQKKGILIKKTSLDHNFKFRKLGMPIKENEQINPHNLLKTYFNYYGSTKNFFCDNTHKIYLAKLANNYEACYYSFKKVQKFLLESIQSVYKSQGISISDKHFEIIIKQMTTKVLITYGGDTPLLPREVIDLYHVKYINEVIFTYNKKPAIYVPLLLGITKAALNNPSFISAASFQETTRILTKASIEGRVDWLRGLKENIITGQLIPVGNKIKIN